jgi:diguanylate cyclase (GGDEF)-like protein/PAS domain S-box-containing protein
MDLGGGAPRADGGGVRRPTLIATLLVTTVVILAAAAVAHLAGRAEHDWAIATEVNALQGHAYRLGGLEWQAIAEGKVSSASSAEVRTTLAATRGSIANLRRTSGSPTLKRFSVALRDYTAAVEQEFALLGAGRVAAAERLDEERVDPGFQRVRASSAAAVSAHRAGAHASTVRARNGSIAIAILSLALIIVLIRRFERSARLLLAAETDQRARRESEDWLRALLHSASDAVVVTDDSGRVTWASQSVERLVGRPVPEIIGTRLGDFLEIEHEHVAATLTDLATAPGTARDVQARLARPGGEKVDVEARITNLLDDPNVRGFVVNARDVSERTQLERSLRHQALHDPLTGLANRALLEDRLEHAVASARRTGGSVAVLFCDIDDFKTINDSLGHHVGDALLVELGARLAAGLRDADSVARLGGDEFAVLLEDVAGPAAAVAIAERLLAAIAEPITTDGRELTVHGSVGIALGSGDTAPADLLRHADVAMYAAKAEGKGRFRLFEDGMHDAVLERLEVRAALSHAVERDELFLAYQPVVSVRSSRLVGVEALVRWQHPERGLVSPADFIPEAEESGLIVGIGRWVLDEATRQFAAWRDEDPMAAPGHVSVNVAGAQLHDPGFVGAVAAAIERNGLQSGELILEVTESSMIDDDGSQAVLEEIRALGVQLALDDFGTGYSALNYLRRFPMDILKIDRSFVRGVTTVEHDAALTRAMIAMAGALGLAVVAEGVEHADQLSELRALDCDLAQGFLFSRPVAPGEILGLVAAQRGGHVDAAA